MRTIVILSVFASFLAAQQQYDLLLKGGHVIDAKNQIDAARDVAIAGGRIARVAAGINPAEARKVVDVSGLYVTPGRVDIHVHVFKRNNPPITMNAEAVQPDAFSFRSGVTTVVDAGSSGWREFPEFRDRVRRRKRACWRSSTVGAGMGTGHENEAAEMDAEAA